MKTIPMLPLVGTSFLLAAAAIFAAAEPDGKNVPAAPLGVARAMFGPSGAELDSTSVAFMRRTHSPDDQTINYPASDVKAQFSLTWKLKQSIPAHSWLRVRANSIHTITTDGVHITNSYEIDKLAFALGTTTGEVPLTQRITDEDFHVNFIYDVNNPVIVGGQIADQMAAGTVLTAGGTLTPKVITGESIMLRLENAAALDGPWTPVTSWDIVATQAAEPARIEAYLRGDGSLYIVYMDRFGNPAPATGRKLTVLTPEGGQVASLGVEGSTVSVPAAAIAPTVQRLEVRDDRGLQALSTARPASGDYRVYFGDIHVHTEYSSDGYRPIADAISSGRDGLGIDFLALSDHIIFPSGYVFQDYLDSVDHFNEPGRFVTIFGFEASTPKGHFNTYFRDRHAAAKFDEAACEDFYREWIESPARLMLKPFLRHFEPEEVLIVPHHTNITSGATVNARGLPFWGQFDWRPVDDRYSRVAEMCQSRGSFETEELDPDWHTKSGGFGASLRTALARGLRFGFVAGSDNHKGWPLREPNKNGYVAMTCVLAHDLTREAIFEAMRDRRTYATTGVRIILDFRLNKIHPMGSIVPLDPRARRTFTLKIRGTSPIDRAEIVSEGAVLAKLKTNGTADLDLDWTEPRPDKPADDCYYYLRVRQTDGNCAWSSPIWVDYAD